MEGTRWRFSYLQEWLDKSGCCLFNLYYCLIFLSFLVLFLNSRLSAEYCFLINKLHIAIFTASAAAEKTLFSMDTLPCNFSSSFSPPGISSSSNMVGSCSTESALLILKPEITLTRAREWESNPCKVETPVTIHKNSAQDAVPRLVGIKLPPVMETTYKNQTSLKKNTIVRSLLMGFQIIFWMIMQLQDAAMLSDLEVNFSKSLFSRIHI